MVTSGGEGKYRSVGGTDTNHWVQDRLKDILHNIGNIANIL